MPDYVASGKDAYHERSIKVFAETDEAALTEAKIQLPVVTLLERIEADGSLTPLADFEYDDPNTEVISPQIIYEQTKIDEQRAARKRNLVAWLVTIAFVLKVFHMLLRSRNN